MLTLLRFIVFPGKIPTNGDRTNRAARLIALCFRVAKLNSPPVMCNLRGPA
jgi:hypothetical protein